MELTKITDCVWFYPFEKERDRPILGYIKGAHFSVAVDAGHSEAHTRPAIKSQYPKSKIQDKF